MDMTIWVKNYVKITITIVTWIVIVTYMTMTIKKTRFAINGDTDQAAYLIVNFSWFFNVHGKIKS